MNFDAYHSCALLGTSPIGTYLLLGQVQQSSQLLFIKWDQKMTNVALEEARRSMPEMASVNK